MWSLGWRDRIWSRLDQPWDLIVIGGGITGAAILREASRVGLRALLVEAGDFSSGTSSRSSKLVHGGFRYLKNGQVRLTIESVRERERLLREGRGLVNPLGQLLVNMPGDRFPPWIFGLGLGLYDLIGLKWGHKHYSAAGLLALCPPLRGVKTLGGYRYIDAQTDDSRLVIRILREAVSDGGVALNYARAGGLLRRASGQVCGIVLRDLAPAGSGRQVEVQAPVVISAVGAWADEIRQQLSASARLRLLRGSHLVFPQARLPVTRSVNFLHPEDQRPVYALPWEGVTIIGTTDVDHDQELKQDPSISEAEVDYLMSFVTHAFPALELSPRDVVCTFSGIRSVVDSGKTDPSKESREHAIWQEEGLLTVTGGKLTTFRLMAHAALRLVRSRLPGRPRFGSRQRAFAKPESDLLASIDLDPSVRLRFLGRYGNEAAQVLGSASPDEMEFISPAQALWTEVHWAAAQEGVVHLEDLMLRRVRLGLLLPSGGLGQIERVRTIVQEQLAWSDETWEKELQDYRNLWQRAYSPPGVAP
jgi:glycerol-3-phosphate dehydrogenase